MTIATKFTTTSLLRVLLAVILVFNGVASASAMVMPCHDMQASVNTDDQHSQHAGHGSHRADSDLPAVTQLPCDGACCDGMACPGHATALIVPQAMALRVTVSGQSLIDQRPTTTDPVLRPVIPPYRPPAS